MKPFWAQSQSYRVYKTSPAPMFNKEKEFLILVIICNDWQINFPFTLDSSPCNFSREDYIPGTRVWSYVVDQKPGHFSISFTTKANFNNSYELCHIKILVSLTSLRYSTNLSYWDIHSLFQIVGKIWPLQLLQQF